MLLKVGQLWCVGKFPEADGQSLFEATSCLGVRLDRQKITAVTTAAIRTG